MLQVEKIIGLVEPKAPAAGEGAAGFAPAPALPSHSTPVQQDACAVQ